MSSFLLKLAGGEKAIAEGEAEMKVLDADLTAIEAKVDPIIDKVAPFLAEVIEDALKACPKVAAVVTPTEITEFSAAVASIPALLKQGHALLQAAEAKLNSL